MIYKNIKKLKVTPTSRLVFSKVYPGYTAHTLEQNEEAIDYRFSKKYNLDKDRSSIIIKQDMDIIGKRGETLVDYAFAKGFSLPNTLNILYSQLSMSDDVEEMFQNFTFSELALARDLFSELENIYLRRVEDAEMSLFCEKEEKDQRLATYFGFLEYFSQIALGVRLGKINFQDFSIYSLDSISNVSRFERSLIASDSSYLQSDINLRKKGQLGTSDVEIATIVQHPTSQYIYKNHTNWR